MSIGVDHFLSSQYFPLPSPHSHDNNFYQHSDQNICGVLYMDGREKSLRSE